MTLVTFHTLPICHMRENFMLNEVICKIFPKTFSRKVIAKIVVQGTQKLEKSRANISEAIQLHAPKIGVVR